MSHHVVTPHRPARGFPSPHVAGFRILDSNFLRTSEHSFDKTLSGSRTRPRCPPWVVAQRGRLVPRHKSGFQSNSEANSRRKELPTNNVFSVDTRDGGTTVIFPFVSCAAIGKTGSRFLKESARRGTPASRPETTASLEGGAHGAHRNLKFSVESFSAPHRGPLHRRGLDGTLVTLGVLQGTFSSGIRVISINNMLRAVVRRASASVSSGTSTSFMPALGQAVLGSQWAGFATDGEKGKEVRNTRPTCIVTAVKSLVVAVSRLASLA